MQRPSSPSSHPAPVGLPAISARSELRGQTFWSLRFHDAALEREYLDHIVKRDSVMCQMYITLSLFVTTVIYALDIRALPEGVGLPQFFYRVAAFTTCWALLMAFLRTPRLRRWLHWLVLGCTMCGAVVLSYSQWLFWSYGLERSYQSILLVVIVFPMLGCMPWRVGTVSGLWCALMIALPEWFCQPNAGVRNLHLGYIAFGAITGIVTAYVHELHSRQQFLVNSRYREQSRIDQLTGLPNRRVLDDVLPRLLRQAAREKSRIAVAMIDIDHFKKYNDHYGHPAGDRVLCAVARAIAEQGKPRPDFVARYGGEEFVAIWFAPQEEPHELGEGVRRAVEEAGLPHDLSSHGHVSISVGIAWQNPTSRSVPEDLLAQADQSLYKAKGKGRNCVRTEQVAVSGNTDILHTRDWQSWQAAAQDDQHTADPTPEVSRADLHRWQSRRGFIEQQQLRWFALIALGTDLTQVLLSYFTMPPQQVALFLQIVGGVLIPVVIIGYCLTFMRWPLRHATRILWMFVLPAGLLVCYVLDNALRHDYPIPYDFLLILIFQGYFVGIQPWHRAALCGWTIALVYMAILYHHGQLMTAIVPLAVVNLIGMVTAFTQDRRNRDIFFKKEKLEQLASHDPLTGLTNRRGLENYIKHLLPMLPTRQHTLAVAMVDVDYFKKYNDYYGHDAGDQVLVAVAQALRENGHRAYDLAVRIGGEEFAIVWYQAKAEEMLELGQRICQSVRLQGIPHRQSDYGQVSVSVGVVHGTLASDDGMAAFDTLLKAADAALYRAKANGRNRAVVGTLPPLHPA